MLAGGLSLSLSFFFFVPSVISPPEPASLPEPASWRGRFSDRAPGVGTAEDLRWLVIAGRLASGAEDGGGGVADIGRDGCSRVVG